MDGFDLLILGFMLRVISADLKLSLALIGAVIGGIVFGMINKWRMVRFQSKGGNNPPRVLGANIITGVCASGPLNPRPDQGATETRQPVGSIGCRVSRLERLVPAHRFPQCEKACGCPM